MGIYAILYNAQNEEIRRVGFYGGEEIISKYGVDNDITEQIHEIVRNYAKALFADYTHYEIRKDEE